MRSHITPVRKVIIKKIKDLEDNLWPVWRVLKKLRIKLPYDPAISLLHIYLKNTTTLIQKGTCTPMFIAALLTIAKTWTQPKCPLMDEWIKEMWYIYNNGIQLSHKKE